MMTVPWAKYNEFDIKSIHIPTQILFESTVGQNAKPQTDSLDQCPGLVPRTETLGEMFPEVPNRGTISDLERNLNAIGRESWDERYRPILPSA